MILPLVLGLLGIVALATSNKKSTAPANTSALDLLPLSLAGMAKQAMATNDPAVLNTAADALEKAGFGTQAAILRQQAAASKKSDGSSPPLPAALQTLMAQALAALTVDGSGRITGPVTAQGVQTASAVAAQLDAAGFPEAATSLRVFITRANAVLPPLTPAETLPLPGLSPEIAAQVNNAIRTNRDPVQLRQMVQLLKSLPPSPQTQQAIDTLSALADQLDAAISTATALQQIQNTLPAQLPTAPASPSAPTIIPSANPAASPGFVPPNSVFNPVPAAGVPAAILSQVQAALGSGNAAQIQSVLTTLGSLSPNPQVQQAIVALQTALSRLNAPPVPGPTPAPAPGQQPVAKSKQQILAETTAAGLVRLQAAAAGNVKKVQGKEDKTGVMQFQKQESLTADGMAGPSFNLALAKYTGNLPLVMYWPKSANAATVLTYRGKLLDMADVADASNDKAKGDALRAAAKAERGQGGIVGAMPA